MPLKFIDLFAGLGGFNLALSGLKHECVFASEIRKDLRDLYKINYPNTPHIEGDITKVKIKDIKTGAVKEVKKTLAADYIGTGKFVLVEEKKEQPKKYNFTGKEE